MVRLLVRESGLTGFEMGIIYVECLDKMGIVFFFIHVHDIKIPF
jgi:hypothetical protein